jgi:hypothetical protein
LYSVRPVPNSDQEFEPARHREEAIRRDQKNADNRDQPPCKKHNTEPTSCMTPAANSEISWTAAGAPRELNLKKNNLRITILAMIVLMGACRDRNQSAAGPSATGSSASSPNPATAPAATNTSTQKWLGQWNGPEGTYLVLSQNPAPNNDKYIVKIRSLDRLDSYDGVPSGDRIQFVRNGKPESIRAGNGEDTGMKWLLDKKNCLIIQSGEGFCRD